MIKFSNWQIEIIGPVARQFDNLSRSIEIEGNIPAEYTWDLMMQSGKNLNIVSLDSTESGLSVILTAEMLAASGYYYIQLRGTQGDMVRHTNVISVYIPSSLSGNVQWPTVPSEFSQAEQRIAELNAHPSIPGDAGYWLVWDLDSHEYVQSELPLPNVSVGPPGEAATVTVSSTETLVPGEPARVENVGTSNAAELKFYIPVGQDGAPGTPGKNGKDGAPGQDGAPGKAATIQIGTVTDGDTAAVTNSGTENAAIFNFTLPRGKQGEPGKDGAPGDPGKDGLGVPEPSLSNAGKVPAVNSTGDGYDLVEISVKASSWQLIKSQTLSEDVEVVSFDFSDKPLQICRVICVPGVQTAGWRQISINGGNSIPTLNTTIGANDMVMWTVEFGPSVIIRAEFGTVKTSNGVNGGGVARGVFKLSDPVFSGIDKITGFALKNAEMCVTGSYFEVWGIPA